MAAAPEIRIPVIPDLATLHALAVAAEKHAGAFRADLEQLMGQDSDEPAGGV